ncbi:MAG: hypothetical protein LKE41_11060 [Prevotella sp.]|jgi:hypothetical protein|nr:hypothetical protein [Prevotella sp.]MCI2080671.1 hypothetical protein [Prevotella sp.]MCI2102559.1 hypothetical protein [Prevotella sp.]
MKHLFTQTRFRFADLSGILVMLWICLASMHGLKASGQNVTISPSSGSLIAGLTYEGEVGFQQGWSSLWRHNQLPLTLHVSDKTDLTASGVLKDPAGNISLDKSQNLYIVDGGERVSTLMSISLPKGFRFTGYRIVLLNNINGKTINNVSHVAMSKRLYETNSKFNYESPLASTALMGSTNETKDYVIERTSKTETDMGNNLYFYFWHASNGFYGATIKSIELYFTAESEFQVEGVPGTPDEIISDGVNMVGSEFTTGKLDLGVIQPNSKGGATYYSYDYENVIDLTAQNWLYQEDAVSGGKLPETAGSGNIQVLRNDGQLYYALGNGTYYIETPIETKNQNGKSIPLGYRITGAQIKAHYGTASGSSTVNFDSKTGTISYKTSGWWGTTYYLQTDGTWDTSPQTKWTLTNTNKLQSGNYYLTVQKFTSNGRSSYIANGTTNKDDASAFTIINNQVKYGDLYLSLYQNNRARFYSDNDYAATWTANQGSVTNPAYTPSDFTLSLYGTKADDVEETAKVSNNNKDLTLEVDGLNNDAVKFTISGLADGAKALITYNLTMEQLNPFINTLDIVCHSPKAEGLKLTQQFTSNDFQVAGGQFLFYVPSDFVGDTNKCKFTFENLSSKYMDDTYGKGTTGNARNYLVKSPYYNTYGDGKQYTTTGNESADDKVRSEMCGDQAFKYNNAADLTNTGTASTAVTLEEYPYSETLYKSQGGTFTEDIEIAVNEEKPCYLFTGDETRYNIAPTTAMEHRYYAYYLMDIELLVKDYNAKCELKELYKTTCYDGNAEKPMYGGTFKAYDKESGAEIPSSKAYLTVNMMKQALMAALTEKGASTDQILYLDYTNLYSVLVETKESMAEMKGELNPNCLIFFPERTTFDEDNYVQKTQSGGFCACKNIVITDKQPFYSPYKISVPAENYAAYKRKITNPMNGKATLATLVLPFSISVRDGVHTNDNCSFTLYQMQTDNGLAIDSEEGDNGTDFWGKAKFNPIPVSLTVPNTPYLVKVENASSDEDVSFEVQQYGSDVDATVNTDGEDGNYMNSDYTFTGEHASGTIGSANHAFTHYGSYSGKKLSKDGGWFYFAQGKFYNSKNLSYKYDKVYVYPFRAYFSHESSNGAKLMGGFNVSFDDDWTTGISDITAESDNSGLQIMTSHGSLSMRASAQAVVTIISASGATLYRTSLNAGETKAVNLSAGIYIVNGKKVIIP